MLQRRALELLSQGYPPNHGPWSPHSNPLGKGGVARGPWEDFDEEDLAEIKEMEKRERMETLEKSILIFGRMQSTQLILSSLFGWIMFLFSL